MGIQFPVERTCTAYYTNLVKWQTLKWPLFSCGGGIFPALKPGFQASTLELAKNNIGSKTDLQPKHRRGDSGAWYTTKAPNNKTTSKNIPHILYSIIIELYKFEFILNGEHHWTSPNFFKRTWNQSNWWGHSVKRVFKFNARESRSRKSFC